MVQSKLFYVHPLRLLYSTVVLAQTKGKGFSLPLSLHVTHVQKFEVCATLNTFVNKYLYTVNSKP